MPESELAGEVTKLIKRADKLVQDTKKDLTELVLALKELKEHLGGRKDAEE